MAQRHRARHRGRAVTIAIERMAWPGRSAHPGERAIVAAAKLAARAREAARILKDDARNAGSSNAC